MGGGRIELLGVDAMLNDLRRKIGSASERIERKGLKAAGTIIQEEMRARAPRSITPRQPAPGTQSWRTGQHAGDNIKLSNIIRKEGLKTVIIGIQRGDNSKYFYLKFFEFGRAGRAPRPWCAPAFEAKKYEAIHILAEEFRKGLME